MGIVTIEGNFYRRKIEYETVACKHCGGVIAVLVPLNAQAKVKDYESKHRCSRCDGPICKACAEEAFRNHGACNPIKARIEHAIKQGRWDEAYRYSFQKS